VLAAAQRLGVGALLLGALVGLAAADFLEVAIYLAGALLEARLCLGQLERLDVRGMEPLLRFLRGAAGLGQLQAARRPAAARLLLRLARGFLFQLARFDQRRQFLYLALALDDAVDAGVGHVEREAMLRAQMAFAADLDVIRRLSQFVGAGGAGDIRQPVVEHAGPVRIVAAHLGPQRVRRRRPCRRIVGQGQRKSLRWRHGERMLRRRRVGRQRRQPLAQYRLDGRFPARLDLDRAPQRLGVGQVLLF